MPEQRYPHGFSGCLIFSNSAKSVTVTGTQEEYHKNRNGGQSTVNHQRTGLVWDFTDTNLTIGDGRDVDYKDTDDFGKP